nr:hypothetical protein [Acholeplasmatales bacterium]
KDVIKTDNLIKHTNYYDLYKLDDDSLYQVQYDENHKLCGTINYKDKEIIIGLFDKSYVNEYLLTQYSYVYIINKSGGMLMHGSSIKYKNKGIIFTAPSGTGKSTHSRLWQKYTDCEVLNDDKNSLKLIDDKLYLYPSPWSGKHRLDNNIISTLDAIVFLYQNKTNEIKRLRPIEALKLLMPQIELLTSENKDLWNKITDKLIMLPCYRYGCNMEKEAFDLINERLCEDLCL